MGVYIECEKTSNSCRLGYHGFDQFRNKVAELLNLEFGVHYATLSTSEMMFTFDMTKRRHLYDEFELEAKRIIEENRISKRAIGFLWQPDCQDRISPSACKIIYRAIKDYDGEILYGYTREIGCTMFNDLKVVFKECCDTNSYLIWY